MPGFLYYLPGRSAGLSLDEAKAAGLGYALDGPISTVNVRGGPGGGDGVMLALSSAMPAEQTHYEPKSQRWRRDPKTDAWVGVYTNAMPSPSDLARARQLAGHEVVLADDRPWLVPVARGWTEEDGELRWYHALPQRSSLGDDGRWEAGEVLPRFAPLWELAMQFEEARRAAVVETAGESARVSLDFRGLHDAAILALQFNYRLGPAEADLLGLLTLDISREILEAVIDLPTRIDWFKKKQSAAADAGLNTGAG